MSLNRKEDIFLISTRNEIRHTTECHKAFCVKKKPESRNFASLLTILAHQLNFHLIMAMRRNTSHSVEMLF